MNGVTFLFFLFGVVGLCWTLFNVADGWRYERARRKKVGGLRLVVGNRRRVS